MAGAAAFDTAALAGAVRGESDADSLNADAAACTRFRSVNLRQARAGNIRIPYQESRAEKATERVREFCNSME